MMKIEERQKLMDKIQVQKMQYLKEVAQVGKVVAGLRKKRNEIEAKISAAYEGNATALSVLSENREIVQKLSEEIELQESRITKLNETLKEVEADTVRLLDVWMDISKKARTDADSLFKKAAALQQQADEARNEAEIHRTEGLRYAGQVRDFAKDLSQETVQKYVDFTY
ncbi:hypothetical protein [Lysinibacillus sp. LZ02]|uniref:hypothetical protein n=1 Tax=Lysinibacillus sp. LZ02 TaxID=3420668 RepID=UPI003D367A19